VKSNILLELVGEGSFKMNKLCEKPLKGRVKVRCRGKIKKALLSQGNFSEPMQLCEACFSALSCSLEILNLASTGELKGPFSLRWANGEK